jgi:hypothetical protein
MPTKRAKKEKVRSERNIELEVMCHPHRRLWQICYLLRRMASETGCVHMTLRVMVSPGKVGVKG